MPAPAYPVLVHVEAAWDYQDALASMAAEVQRRRSAPGTLPGILFFVTHPPTVTLGRRSHGEAVSVPPSCAVVSADRGGRATYHGPGQLVVYFVLELSRLGFGIKDLVMSVADGAAAALDELGTPSHFDPCHPGLWTDAEPRRKLGSLGMRNQAGVTSHGLAINVDVRPFGFRWIEPCGMSFEKVASLSDYGVECSVDSVASVVLRKLEDALGVYVEVPPNFSRLSPATPRS